jgi:hypothetical protein
LSSNTAARSEAEAVRLFLKPFQEAIAAFAANVVFTQSRPDPATRIRALTVARDDVVSLRDGDGEPRLALRTELAFRTVLLPGQPKRWTVETTRYIYHLEEPTDPVRELVAYHWHPEVEGISFPHIHMRAAAAAARRMHVATPHSTLKEVIATAMRDYDVSPLKRHHDTWEALLIKADQTLQASMRWATSP